MLFKGSDTSRTFGFGHTWFQADSLDNSVLFRFVIIMLERKVFDSDGLDFGFGGFSDLTAEVETSNQVVLFVELENHITAEIDGSLVQGIENFGSDSYHNFIRLKQCLDV